MSFRAVDVGWGMFVGVGVDLEVGDVEFVRPRLNIL